MATAYYLSSVFPNVVQHGPLLGGWHSTGDGPRATGIQQYTWELITVADANNTRSTEELTNNRQAEAVLFHRWVSPRLEAQTVSGTVNVLQKVRAGWADNIGGQWQAGLSEVVFRLHVYIAVGDTLALRATLLNQYVDSANLWTTVATYRSLTAAQALDPGDAQAGDRIVVELGAFINTAPQPAPTLPPSAWTQIQMERGTAGGGTLNTLTFSQTLVEQAYSGTVPTHTTCATAKTVLAIPYTDTADTTQIPASTTKELWYAWTPTTSERVILHCFGSGPVLAITPQEAKTPGDNPCTTFWFSTYVLRTIDHVYTSLACVVMDVVAGLPYRMRVYNPTTLAFPSQTGAVGAGGFMSFTITPEVAPENNDVIIASSGFLGRYRGTTLVGLGYVSATLSGLAIDYTRRPMTNLNGGIHTGHRLYVGVFTRYFGTVEILDLASLNNGEQEIDFLSAALGGSAPIAANRNEHLATLAINAAGMLVVGWFGDGFRRTANRGTSWQDRVSSSVDAEINVIDAIRADNQAGAPWPPALRYPVTLEAGGTNYLDVALDDDTIFYTSADWYFPSAGGHTVFRMSASTGTQLAAFAVVPVPISPTPSVKGLFPLPDGGCLVCNGNTIVRLDSGGGVIQTYTPTPAARYQSLADVELTASGRTFWALDEESVSLVQFDLATGTQLAEHWTHLGAEACTSLVIYRTEPLVPIGPPPPICPPLPPPESVTPGPPCVLGLFP